ncbi:MAG: hypothetical protein QNJ44_22620 [Rhodobacter sp.]|nr:hypothetical protein [Rhodobacter sp.]
MFDLAPIPSIRDQAIVRGIDGATPERTARELQVPVSHVMRWWRQARDQGARIGYFNPKPALARQAAIPLDRRTRAQLEMAARRRGTTPRALGQALLAAIVARDLIGTVLDDG